MVNHTNQGYSNSRHASRSEAGMFKELDATELYCSKCRMAVPVRKRLLLVLPEGDKYEYFCPYCAETVGTKIDRQQDQQNSIIIS